MSSKLLNLSREDLEIIDLSMPKFNPPPKQSHCRLAVPVNGKAQ